MHRSTSPSRPHHPRFAVSRGRAGIGRYKLKAQAGGRKRKRSFAIIEGDWRDGKTALEAVFYDVAGEWYERRAGITARRQSAEEGVGEKERRYGRKGRVWTRGRKKETAL